MPKTLRDREFAIHENIIILSLNNKEALDGAMQDLVVEGDKQKLINALAVCAVRHPLFYSMLFQALRAAEDQIINRPCNNKLL